jgi:hypothetical protein
MALNWVASIHSPAPMTLSVPDFGTAGSNSATLFTTDINGDGNSGSSTPRPDVISTIGVGGMDRTIRNWDDLNRAIDLFNSKYAGKPTPAGQALINAGLITADQLAALGGVVQTIPHVVTTNPWPFQWWYNADLRISRPFHPGKEKVTINPFLDVFNIFNHTGFNTYSGTGTLAGPWTSDPGGWLVDYSKTPFDLNGYRGRQTRADGTDNRLLQIGVRIAW